MGGDTGERLGGGGGGVGLELCELKLVRGWVSGRGGGDALATGVGRP